MRKNRSRSPLPTFNARTMANHRAANRALSVLMLSLSAAAHAAGGQIGGGLITYAQPIILFLGVGSVVVALVGAVFRPELVKGAVWAAVILVIVFFILRNTSALQSAVQAG